MKKFFSLSFLLLALGFQLAAQTLPTPPQTTEAVANSAVQRGNWLVGAKVGSIGQNFKSNTFTLDINPRAGYFISDNAAIGAEVQLGLQLYDKGQSFNYGLAPFVRYYFPEGAAPTHRWFGEARVGFSGSSLEDSDDDSAISALYGVSAGYAHFVARNVALEGTLDLTRSHADVNVGNAGKTGLSLGLAFQIYLPSRANR